MRYMLLIYVDPRDEAARSEEDAAKILDRYRRLSAELRQEGRWVDALRLPPTPPASIRLSPEEGVAITDGPFTETKELLAGFFIIKAASMDEATAVAARIPAAETGCVEVRELMDLDARFGGR